MARTARQAVLFDPPMARGDASSKALRDSGTRTSSRQDPELLSATDVVIKDFHYKPGEPLHESLRFKERLLEDIKAAWRADPGQDAFAALNTPEMHDRYNVPEGGYIEAEKGGLIVSTGSKHTIQSLLTAEGELILRDPGEFDILKQLKKKAKDGAIKVFESELHNRPITIPSTIADLEARYTHFDPDMPRDYTSDFMRDVGADLSYEDWLTYGLIGMQFPESGIKGFIERSVLHAHKNGINQYIETILDQKVKDLLAQDPTKRVQEVEFLESDRRLPWWDQFAGIRNDVATSDNSFITELQRMRNEIRTELQDLIEGHHVRHQEFTAIPYPNTKTRGDRVKIVPSDMIYQQGLLENAEQLVAAWAVTEMLRMAMRDQHLSLSKTQVEQLTSMLERRGLGHTPLPERLAILEGIHMVDDGAFTSKGSVPGLFDAMAKYLQGDRSDLKTLITDLRKQKNLLRQLCAAQLNQDAMHPRQATPGQGWLWDGSYSQRTGQEWNSMYLVRKTKNMHRISDARFLNPHADTTQTKLKDMVKVDGYFHDGTKQIFVECKFIERLAGGSEVINGRTIRERWAGPLRSSYNTIHAATRSNGGISRPEMMEIFLVVTQDIGTTQITSNDVANDRPFIDLRMANDRRYTIIRQLPLSNTKRNIGATGQNMAWEVEVHMPFKLDALRQELLIEAIGNYINDPSNAGKTVAQMCAEIKQNPRAYVNSLPAWATMRFPISPEGELFLVQNRDANGNMIYEDLDPLAITGEERWDSEPYNSEGDVVEIFDSSRSITIAEFKNILDSKNIQLGDLEGFYREEERVIFRVLRTRTTRTDIIAQNMVLVDVLCELAGVQNELRIETGWWTIL